MSIYVIISVAVLSFLLGAWFGIQWQTKKKKPEMKEMREDLLKSIFQLKRDGYEPTEKYLRNALRWTNGQLKQVEQNLWKSGDLEQDKLVLTQKGEQKAIQIVRKHRLYEMYLAEYTGYAPKEWHEKAEKMEHKLEEDYINEIDQLLGFPKFDPHGSPIPNVTGEFVNYQSKNPQVAPTQTLLTDLKMGESATVMGLSKDCRGQARRRLLDLGFVRGSKVSIDLKSPLGNPIAYMVKGSTIALRQDQAQYIYISK